MKTLDDNEEIKVFLDIEDIIKDTSEGKPYVFVKKELKQDINDVECSDELIIDLYKNVDKLNDDKVKYHMKIEKDGFYYDGFTTSEFSRQNFGINNYSKGDIYIGYWMDNKRHGSGYYHYKHEVSSDYGEYFFGDFNNNQIDSVGVYIWMHTDPNTTDYKSSSFDMQAGFISQGLFKTGIYFNKIEENYYIYYGGFSNLIQGYKTDKKGFFYDSIKKRSFIGHIKEDEIQTGYLILNNENPDDSKGSADVDYSKYQLTFLEMDDNQPVNVKKDNEIDIFDKEDIVEKTNKFIKILSPHEKDTFFEDCYNVLKSLLNFEKKEYRRNIKSTDEKEDLIKTFNELLDKKVFNDYFNKLGKIKK